MVEFDPYDWRDIPERLIGQERILEEMKSQLNSGADFLMIYGLTGCGKTALAKKLIEELKKDKGFVPVWMPCDIVSGLKDVNFVENFYKPALRKYYSIPVLSRLVKPRDEVKRNQQVVLFVDEFHALRREIVEQIKAAYDEKLVYSLIIIQVNKELNPEQKLPKTISGRISKRVTPNQLNAAQLKQMVKDRFDLFEDQVLDYIIKKAAKNPRTVLIGCSNLRRMFLKESGEKITLKEASSVKDLFEFIEEKDAEVPEHEEEGAATKSKINWNALAKVPPPLQCDVLEYMFDRDETPVTVSDLSKHLRKGDKNVLAQLSKLYKQKLISKVDNKRPARYVLTRETLRALTTD